MSIMQQLWDRTTMCLLPFSFVTMLAQFAQACSLFDDLDSCHQGDPEMISVLLFDVGDTLLDASSGQQDALQEAHRTALAKFGFELSAGEYQQLDHEKMLQFVPSAMHAITWHFARPDVCLFNEIIEEVRSHYPQIRALGFRLHPGIAAVLEQLAGESGEYTLALAGNAPADITEVLDDLGVLRWFRHREVSGSIGVKKPDEPSLQKGWGSGPYGSGRAGTPLLSRGFRMNSRMRPFSTWNPCLRRSVRLQRGRHDQALDDRCHNDRDRGGVGARNRRPGVPGIQQRHR